VGDSTATRAAGVDQHLADQVQPLLRAGGDEHLRRIGLQALRAQLGRHPLAQRAEAFAGGVLQRLARRLAQHAAAGLAHRLHRKALGAGSPPASEITPGFR
jgi:hypothetical protein